MQSVLVPRARVALLALVLCLGGVFTLAPVAAQTATAVPVTGDQTFSGQISKLTPLTVTSNGVDRQVNPAPNVAVVKGGSAATLADLKVGDQVNVTSRPDNTASRIEAQGAPPVGAAGTGAAGAATFAGKLTTLSPLTLNANGMDRVLTPAMGVTVTRNGKPAALTDLKPGDDLNVSANPDNTVRTIAATSADAPAVSAVAPAAVAPIAATGAATAAAPATVVPATRAATAVPAPTTFTGKVTNTSPFTVNTNGLDRAVNTAAAVNVTRNGNAAKLSDVKKDDQVTVTANPDGTATAIAATGDAGGFPGWLIPLLLLLLVLALLAFFLSRRRKNDFVLESNETPPTSSRR